MTIFAILMSFLACGAWIASEQRVRHLERDLHQLRRRYVRRGVLLRTAHKDIDALMSLLGQAISQQAPRKVGDHIDFTVWPEQKKLRLMTDLDLNGSDDPA